MDPSVVEDSAGRLRGPRAFRGLLIRAILAAAVAAVAIIVAGTSAPAAAQEARSPDAVALAEARGAAVPHRTLLDMPRDSLLRIMGGRPGDEATDAPSWTFRMDGGTTAGAASAVAAWIGGFDETDGACPDPDDEPIRRVHGDVPYETCLHGDGTLLILFSGACHDARSVDAFRVAGGRVGSDFVLVFSDYEEKEATELNFPEQVSCLWEGPKELAQLGLALWGADGPQRTVLRIPADRAVAWDTFDLGGMTAVLEVTEGVPLVPLTP